MMWVAPSSNDNTTDITTRNEGMNLFEKIRIQGFRRLQDVELKLRPLNVVIGANGSGKTSLLDIFSLLAASAEGKLSETLSELGGLDANLTNLKATQGEKANSLTFDIAMSISDRRPLEYHLSLLQQGVGYVIPEEYLAQNRDDIDPEFKYFIRSQGRVELKDSKKTNHRVTLSGPKAGESALSQVRMLFDEVVEFPSMLSSSSHYHVLDVSRRAPIRLPQQLRDARLPGRDGEGLVSCLYGLRELDPDRFEMIEDTLRAGFPKFERLGFPLVAAGMLAMTWKETTSKHPFYMHQLSEGTLRFLWLVTLLNSPGLTSVTMIDEPEVSLHPELLSVLADVFRDASQRTQLIVATHADRLVRFLRPSEVLTISGKEDGTAEFAWADEFDVAPWLEEYTLDQVWGMGRIGGRA